MPENLPFLLPLLGWGSSPRPTSLSKSVTSRRQYRLQMLQIETILNVAGPLSQSVTARPIFAELLLQIETNCREHLPHQQNPTKGQVPLRWFEHLFYTYTCSIVGVLALDLNCN